MPRKEKLPALDDLQEVLAKGYSQRQDGRVFTVAKSFSDEQADRGAVVAQALTDESFADEVARQAWDALPETQRYAMLVDFRCSDCFLRDTQGLSPQEVADLSPEALEEALEAGLAVRRAQTGNPHEAPEAITQLENIVISFAPSDAPGAGGGNVLQITGDCVRCGTSLTRTMMGEHARMAQALGGMLRLMEKARGKKAGRNDPCPCGSGKKYKKCCGAEGAGEGEAT